MRSVAFFLLLSYLCVAVSNVAASPFAECFHAAMSVGNHSTTEGNDCHCDTGAGVKAEHMMGKTRSVAPALTQCHSDFRGTRFLAVLSRGMNKPGPAFSNATNAIPLSVLYCSFRL